MGSFFKTYIVMSSENKDNIISFLPFFGGGTGVQIQGLALARQAPF
jgi:hypothetical protein